MAQIKVYNGSSWLAPNVKHYNGSSWIDHNTKYYNGSGWVSLESSVAPLVSARADGRSNSILGDTCYSGCAFYTTGLEYEYTAAGSLTNSTTWLDQGTSDQVWVMWTRTSGTLSDWNSLGSGNNNIRRQINTTRAFRIVRSASGTHTILGYFRFYDAASGGNLLQTTSTVTWSAEYDFDPCPICCFTPDTPIMLSSGIEIAIGKIKEGDKILSAIPGTQELTEQVVTGIITRDNRPMYRITFDDGSHLDASADHPIHVKDVGPASIDFHHEKYKDLLPRRQLMAGDYVVCHQGYYKRVEKIAQLDFRGTVFTLENSPFFANGILVY